MSTTPYYKLEAVFADPVISVLRPAPPYADPKDLASVGVIRWHVHRDKSAPVFVPAAHVILSRPTIEAILEALARCDTREKFLELAGQSQPKGAAP